MGAQWGGGAVQITKRKDDTSMTYKVLINGTLNAPLLSDVREKLKAFGLETEVKTTYYNYIKEQELIIRGVINYDHDKFLELINSLPSATGTISCVDEDLNVWQFRKQDEDDTIWLCRTMKITDDE